MASSEPKKANNPCLVETDMVTNLPDDVKEKILTYLPIKEAGRTSILSSKWRYMWASIPELKLRDTNRAPNFVEFVDTIFLLHNGPIRKFNLVTRQDCYIAFDKWIVNLSRNGIRELTLDVSSVEYIMHSRFFSCEELNYIDLTNCSFKLPLYFKGFKLLHTLALKHFKASEEDIKMLITSCPLMKKVKIVDLRESIGLIIHAPNLHILDIRSEFSDLQVRAPKLLSIYVHLKTPARKQPCRNKFDRVLGNVSALEKFHLVGCFIQYLCDEPFGLRFSQTFNRLKMLNFSLCFEVLKENAFVLTMLRLTPHLKSLFITVDLIEGGGTFPVANFWEKVGRREGLLKHLQTVNIYYFRAIDLMFSFVEFILVSAPQLVTLTIEKDLEDQQDEGITLRKLLQFERASPKAKIVFK